MTKQVLASKVFLLTDAPPLSDTMHPYSSEQILHCNLNKTYIGNSVEPGNLVAMQQADFTHKNILKAMPLQDIILTP